MAQFMDLEAGVAQEEEDGEEEEEEEKIVSRTKRRLKPYKRLRQKAVKMAVAPSPPKEKGEEEEEEDPDLAAALEAVVLPPALAAGDVLVAQLSLSQLHVLAKICDMLKVKKDSVVQVTRNAEHRVVFQLTEFSFSYVQHVVFKQWQHLAMREHFHVVVPTAAMARQCERMFRMNTVVVNLQVTEERWVMTGYNQEGQETCCSGVSLLALGQLEVQPVEMLSFPIELRCPTDTLCTVVSENLGAVMTVVGDRTGRLRFRSNDQVETGTLTIHLERGHPLLAGYRGTFGAKKFTMLKKGMSLGRMVTLRLGMEDVRTPMPFCVQWNREEVLIDIFITAQEEEE